MICCQEWRKQDLEDMGRLERVKGKSFAMFFYSNEKGGVWHMWVHCPSLIPEHNSLMYTIDRKTSQCAIKLTTKHQGYFVMK